MRVPLRGRDFDARDSDKSAPVAIVSETLARRYFPGEDAVGQRLLAPAAKMLGDQFFKCMQAQVKG